MQRVSNIRYGARIALSVLVVLFTTRGAIRPRLHAAVQVPYSGMLAEEGELVAMVGTRMSFVLFDATTTPPTQLFEIPGLELSGVDIHPTLPKAYVSDGFNGRVSVIAFNTQAVSNSISVGKEPKGVLLSPNGTRLYVANSSSNSLSVIDTATELVVATTDLSNFCTSPRALSCTNDGDADDTDETVLVACFFSDLRPGKTIDQECQDDQREGRVVAVSAATNALLGSPNPITLGPIADTGFNANGRLAPFTGSTPNVAPTNPPQFTTSTGAFPNQLAAIALHPLNGRAYVFETAASPNGPLRYDSNVQPLVSMFDVATRTEVTAPQTDVSVRRTAPLNLNRGIDLTPAPRLFLSNPVAGVWRPDGSDAWIVIQNSNAVVRMTVDGTGIPTIGSPLTAGPGQIVLVDLQNVGAGQIAGEAPNGIAFSSDGTKIYVSNEVSRSLTVIDVSNATSPSIVATVAAEPQPQPGTVEEKIQHGKRLFYTGRQGMSRDGWGSCASCHPDGLSDNVTWMFPSGPRQTPSLDGTFANGQQRILNWSATFDEVEDFELMARNVCGGQGLIKDDQQFFAIGGSSGGLPLNSILQFQQSSGSVGTTNDLAGGATIPTLPDGRRDFATATLTDGRVLIIGGRTGPGQGTLVTGENTVLEFNPRTNTLTQRSATGFTPRHSLGAVAVRTSGGPRIYALGGITTTLNNGNPTNIVQEYNPATNTWRPVANLFLAVAQFGIAATGGINSAESNQQISISFGNRGTEASPNVTNVIQVFVPSATGAGSSFSPTSGTSSLTPRRGHGAATIVRGTSSRILIMGGQDALGNVLDTVQEFFWFGSPVSSTHTPLPMPVMNFGVATKQSTEENSVMVIGGVNGSGVEQSTVLEYSVAINGPVAGPAGTPSGAWVLRANLPAPVSGVGVSSPPGVTPLVPVRSSQRADDWESIRLYIANGIRSSRAPVSPSDPMAILGQTRFNQVGLVTSGNSCATCHSSPRWTPSVVDFPPPPSPDFNLGQGNERILGGQLSRTATQTSVLLNVGTFGGNFRLNEFRINPADPGHCIGAMGSNGFNIPSLLNVHQTAPYFHSGTALTLEQVLDGSQDQFVGGTRHHFVDIPEYRDQIIAFLNTIESAVTPPAVTTSPSDQTVCPGATAMFSAAASGSPAPIPQWQLSTNGGSTFANIVGATSSPLSFAAGPTQSGYQYRVVFTNRAGTTTTAPATLTVGGTDTTPAITTHPVSKIAADGRSVTFTAAADGTPPPTVRWQCSTNGGTSFFDVVGETSLNLILVATSSAHGNRYRAVFSNSCGDAPTQAATLQVRGFTDPVLQAGVTRPKAVHVLEPRAWINELRVRFGLPLFIWTNEPMTAGAPFLATDIIEMRQALAEAYVQAGRAAPSYTRTIAAGVTVGKSEFEEIRAAIIALEP